MRSRASSWSQWPLLVGCAVLASFTPPGPGPDGQLRRRIGERLAADPTTRPIALRVTAASGVATVSGEIADRAEEQRVLAVVGQTDGVLDLIDDLRISDAVIRRNVINALRADPTVANVPVTVDCVDAEVTLRSNQTNEAQRRRMVQIAASVDSVSHVVDDMR